MNDFVQMWELLSYIATVIGIPLAISFYLLEEKKERQSEKEETFLELNSQYKELLELLIENPEIDQHDLPLEKEQSRKMQMNFYQMLIGLFETSFISLYGERDKDYQRMWNSWHDYICEWVEKPNFRASLPLLMRGEDPAFTAYMSDVSKLSLTFQRLSSPDGVA